MPWLFSYGSNSPTRLENRLNHDIPNMKAAVLRNYMRVFRGYSRNWNGGTASVVQQVGKSVYGFVAEITLNDLEYLDRLEGVAVCKYRREQILVEDVHGNEILAFIYVHSSPLFGSPGPSYLDAVVETVGSFWKNADGSPITVKDIPIR